METILALIQDNKVLTGVIAIATVLLGPQAKDKLVSLFSFLKSKLPKKVVAQASGEDEELLDQMAIRRLRDRAATFGDEALIKDIKAIDSKFYDIHAKGKVNA